MSNLRDEISKIVDMRIPKGGYRRYLYEIDRTGGFNMKTVLDMLIVMSTTIEELESQLEALQHTPTPSSTSIDLSDYRTEAPQTHKAVPTDFQCAECGKMFTSKLALMGHSRSHKKDETTDQSKHNA